MDNPLCDIKKDPSQAHVLQESKVIVWDECTISHKLAFEALDMTMQEFRNSNKLMGAVTLVMSGDFCHTQPVVPSAHLLMN